MMFLAIAMVIGVNFASAQVYIPLVQIPGLPPGGAVNLSMYLVGLYDFLLSIVGIAAVMMLIIGGMRYITAAGNQAAVSDAKDIITSALAGLLLAILSWIVVAEINPDVLYIKKPGGSFVDTDSVDLGKCGTFDPLVIPPAPNCQCIGGGAPFLALHQDNCDWQCKKMELCNLPEPKVCTASGCPSKITTDDNSEFMLLPYEGKCHCIDDEFVEPDPAATTCQEVCSNPAMASDGKQHCGWDFLVVRANTDHITRDSTNIYWELPHDSSDEDRNKMYDFFLTNDGEWGAFGITADSYTVGLTTYECAILVTSRRSIALWGISVAGDYRNIFWVKKGTEIGIKNDSSMQNEIGAKNVDYVQCCDQRVFGFNTACKVSAWATPGCDCGTTATCLLPNPLTCSAAGNPGSNAPCATYCAEELLDLKYENLSTDKDCSNCSAALSGNRFQPQHLICDASTGKWRRK